MSTAGLPSSRQLNPVAVSAWAQAGWLHAGPGRGARLSEADLARARLILDLEADMGINEHGIAVIVELLDQLHGLRVLLGDLVAAISVQPDGPRHRLVADARRMARLRRNPHRAERSAAAHR